MTLRLESEAEYPKADAFSVEGANPHDSTPRPAPLTFAFTRAETLNGIGLLELAVANYPDDSRVLALDAHYQMTAFGLDWCEDRERTYARALSSAEKALAIGRADPLTLGYCAMNAAYLEERPIRALGMIEQAISRRPNSSLMRHLLGWILLRNGDSELAHATFQAAITAEPDTRDLRAIQCGMALARLEQGQFAEAAGLARLAAEQTDHPLCYMALTVAYAHLGKTAAAGRALVRYRAHCSRPIARLAVAVSCRPDHRLSFLNGVALAEKALEDHAAWVAAHPDPVPSFLRERTGRGAF